MQRMSATELKSLQEEIRQRMEEAGYPGGGVDARAKVDRAIARTLVELDLPVGEMLRRDVWTWMSIHLLPDYLVWRWAKPAWTITEVRVSGALQRNALGRMGLSGMWFDRGAG